MYLPDSASDDDPTARALALLEAAVDSPETACQDDPDVKAAFDESLRQLAEDIVDYHPGLAHLLIGMSETPCPATHGQN